MNHGSAQHIIHDVLRFPKLFAKWVASQLIAELKEWYFDVCQGH